MSPMDSCLGVGGRESHWCEARNCGVNAVQGSKEALWFELLVGVPDLVVEGGEPWGVDVGVGEFPPHPVRTASIAAKVATPADRLPVPNLIP
jgi:hypothetical protein